ncbi:MAG: 3-oxo-tetronate kinase [Acidobacteriota bacterium]
MAKGYLPTLYIDRVVVQTGSLPTCDGLEAWRRSHSMNRKPEAPLLGAIADDYTGGADLAGMLSERGVHTVQILGLQSDELVWQLCGYQAIVISLKARSSTVSEACSLSAQALDQLTRLGVRQVQFKYCSTFDSTRQGNIGPVIDLLMENLRTPFTLAVPALPVNGRTQYLGHLFVGTQLLSDSHMRCHPLTPMTESNLVRHLQSQTRRKVGLVAYPTVRRGTASILHECCRLRVDGVAIALVDAMTDQDLHEISEAALDLPLITGSSGLVGALPAIWRRRGWLASGARAPCARPAITTDMVLIISGSCSAVTLQQIQQFLSFGGRLISIDPLRVLAHGPEAEIALLLSAVKRAIDNERAIMVSSSAGPTEREKTARELRTHDVAPDRICRLIEQTFAGLAVRIVHNGLSSRVIVAGGETSGAVVDALQIRAAEVMGLIDPGVPYLKSIGGQPLALALKSGNFGGPDFFMRACHLLRGICLE